MVEDKASKLKQEITGASVWFSRNMDFLVFKALIT